MKWFGSPLLVKLLYCTLQPCDSHSPFKQKNMDKRMEIPSDMPVSEFWHINTLIAACTLLKINMTHKGYLQSNPRGIASHIWNSSQWVNTCWGMKSPLKTLSTAVQSQYQQWQPPQSYYCCRKHDTFWTSQTTPYFQKSHLLPCFTCLILRSLYDDHFTHGMFLWSWSSFQMLRRFSMFFNTVLYLIHFLSN